MYAQCVPCAELARFRRPDILGANLGARPGNWLRPKVDAGGGWAAANEPEEVPLDRNGRSIETYGSEGWGFESLRVRQR